MTDQAAPIAAATAPNQPAGRLAESTGIAQLRGICDISDRGNIVVKPWYSDGPTSDGLTMKPSRSSPRPPAIAAHIAQRDLLGLYREGNPDYKRIADLVQLSKADLSKISGVAKSSVRFDVNIPVPVAERLRELANIANLVAEFFNGDVHKVALWFELANPLLGNVSPRDMIRGGRYKRLLNFVLDAREAEKAAPKNSA